MGISKTQLATDLGYMISDLPTVFTLAGATYGGVLTDLSDTTALDIGGMGETNQASLYCKQADFSSLPTVGLTVSISSDRYRITRITKTPDDAGIVLELDSTEK